MFETGDKIVYPMHGAGMIHAVEKRSDEKGDVVEYFILDMLLGDMKIMIPIKNVEQVGLRHVISEEQLVDIEDVLTSRPENKMKSGDIFEVAAVVRTLTVQEEDKKLSTGERRLLNTARQILLSEVMLVRSQKLEDADKWLHQFFNLN